MKFKSLKRILIGGFAIAATFGMASCSGEEALNTDFINETNEKLAYSTTTALTMLDEEVVTPESTDEVTTPENSSEAEAPVEEEAPSQGETVEEEAPSQGETTEVLPEIIDQADLIINNNAEFSFISIESDRDEYLNLSIISFKDHEGIVHTFKLYYNDVTEEVEEDDDEIETKLSYTGLVVYNDNEYTFEFSSETEVEEDETEIETKLVIFTGENSYISIKNESENEENETEEKFSYKVVEDGKTILSYSVSNEFEDGKTKVKVKLNGETYKIVEKIKDGKKGIMLEVGKHGSFYERTKGSDGKYKFHFNGKYELNDTDIQNIKDFISNKKNEE